MKKWLILTIMLLMIPIATALEPDHICEGTLKPGKNCTMLTPVTVCEEYNYTILDTNGIVEADKELEQIENGNYKLTFNLSTGDYVVRLCNNATREILVLHEEDDMGSLALTFFGLFVATGLFLLPFFKKFSDFEITNMIMKRACWTIAIYIMMLNSAIMATVAEQAGLPLTDEMFRFMWFFGWAGYIFMGFMVIKTLFDVLRMWNIQKKNKRMGGE